MLGFTKNEQRVLWFLFVGFFSGLIIWTYQKKFQPLPEIMNPPPKIRTESQATIQSYQKTTGDFIRVGSDTSKNQDFININTASLTELIVIPGIGPVMAERIIEYREKNGDFQSKDALLNIKGIGPKTLEKLNQYIIIDSM